MSVTELKNVVDQASPEERLYLQAYLHHRRLQNDSRYLRELSRRRDSGQCHDLNQVKQLHETLVSGGL